MTNPQPDRKDLKIQALLERISSLENQIADLRVELTVVNMNAMQKSSGEKEGPHDEEPLQ